MFQQEIEKVENEIRELTSKLEALRKQTPPLKVKNYALQILEGETTLKDLFAGKDTLLAIHNMGQGCRYCTMWADGINAFLPHLEDQLSVVLLSKDSPKTQRIFANSRGWRLRMASHQGGSYIKEQTLAPGESNMPGAVVYRLIDGEVYRLNASVFGPGDQFCSFWHFLSLAGKGEETFTPQYSYWRRPETMDDGGKNLSV
jgi:predicted dithiol-disulfide oxidoreductase (DUF899 family)